MKHSTHCVRLLTLSTLLLLAGCQTMYYSTLETFGVPKRDILVNRVDDARETQEEAKQEFVDALDAFTAVVKMSGGDLEHNYKVLSSRLSSCQSRADAVRTRIARVESTGNALFDEWANELNLYTNPEIRRASEARMHEARLQFDQMVHRMWLAEQTMGPVLNAFRDQVLYLKHNLNAMAVTSLQSELLSVEQDVAVLVREMEAAIAEADRFVRIL